MTREQAISAYRRTKDWEVRASENLRKSLIARGAVEPISCTLHNWGHCGGQEPYRSLYREEQYRQRQIWDTSSRLQEAFGQYF